MVGVNYTETIVATLEFVRSRIFSLTRSKIYVFIPIKKMMKIVQNNYNQKLYSRSN